MSTKDYGSGCFEVLWCILSLMLGANDLMSNRFRFFCCISSLQVTAEADVLGFLLCKVLVVSLIIDFLRRVCGRK